MAVTACGESRPSAKATAKVANLAFMCNSTQASDCPVGAKAEATILSQKIKTPLQKYLFVDASLECGLRTDTQVERAKGRKSTATAKADVIVLVLLDGDDVTSKALPAVPVNFCSRSQDLSATFDGLLPTCLIPDPQCVARCVTDPNPAACSAACPLAVDSVCLETLPPEQVGLILDTVEASAFNFIIPEVPAGVHEVEANAKIGKLTNLAGDNLYGSSAATEGSWAGAQSRSSRCESSRAKTSSTFRKPPLPRKQEGIPSEEVPSFRTPCISATIPLHNGPYGARWDLLPNGGAGLRGR